MRLIMAASVAWAVVLLAGSTVSAQAVADLAVAVTAEPDPACRGGSVAYAVTYSNLGPDPATDAYMNLTLPPGVPAPLDVLIGAPILEVVDEFSDSLGNVPLLFVDISCESLLVQLQGPDDDTPPNPVQELEPGESGLLSVVVALPMEPPLAPRVRVESPAEIAGDLAFGQTSCDTCYDLSTCCGRRVSEIETVVAGAVLVDDGTDTPTFGCVPLVNDLTGRVALVDRGGCQFIQKLFNAERAGALATVIINDDRPSPDDVVPMGCETTLTFETPLVMVSQNNGSRIKHHLDDGVVMKVGAFADFGTAYSVVAKAEVFFGRGGDVDPDERNNTAYVTTDVSSLVDHDRRQREGPETE